MPGARADLLLLNPQDPALARDLFIKHGLVEGLMGMRGEFALARRTLDLLPPADRSEDRAVSVAMASRLDAPRTALICCARRMASVSPRCRRARMSGAAMADCTACCSTEAPAVRASDPASLVSSATWCSATPLAIARGTGRSLDDVQEALARIAIDARHQTAGRQRQIALQRADRGIARQRLTRIDPDRHHRRAHRQRRAIAVQNHAAHGHHRLDAQRAGIALLAQKLAVDHGQVRRTPNQACQQQHEQGQQAAARQGVG